MPGISNLPTSSGWRLTNAPISVSGSGFADGIRDVNREEIGGIEKAIHGFETDVVGVNMPGLPPAEFRDGLGSSGADTGRFGTDDCVLAMGFIPDRNDVDALPGCRMQA